MGAGAMEETKFVLVMERIEGRNLVEVLDDEGVWPDEAVLDMMLSVLAVLRHVHNKGVLHRDIKVRWCGREDV